MNEQRASILTCFSFCLQDSTLFHSLQRTCLVSLWPLFLGIPYRIGSIHKRNKEGWESRVSGNDRELCLSPALGTAKCAFCSEENTGSPCCSLNPSFKVWVSFLYMVAKSRTSYPNPLLLAPSQRGPTGRHSPPEKGTGVQNSMALGPALSTPAWWVLGKVCGSQQTTVLSTLRERGNTSHQQIRGESSDKSSVRAQPWLSVSLSPFSFTSLSPERLIHWLTKSVKFRESLGNQWN